jgi:hypothetical protein
MVMVLEMSAGQSGHCTSVRRPGDAAARVRALRRFPWFDMMFSLAENDCRFKQLRQFHRVVPERHDAKKKLTKIAKHRILSLLCC